MRNWKVGVWRGDNSGDSGEPGWGQEAGRVDLSQRGTRNWKPEYRRIARTKEWRKVEERKDQ